MEKYIIFGAGIFGKKAITLLEKENIEFILDNDPLKWGKYIDGIIICRPEEKKQFLKEYCIVLAVPQKYQKDILEQLHQLDAENIQSFQEMQTKYTKRKIENRIDYVSVYKKALQWVNTHTIKGQSIICNTDKPKGYPEVTGYYIPTLLKWGYRDIAVSYAKWLCKIQKEDGSWFDTDNRNPYVFDTAQILKGLIEIRKIYPKVEKHVLKGCDWIINNMLESGRLVTPSLEAWNNTECSELVHLYCLSPLIHASEIFYKPEYEEAAYKILNYYKQNHYEEVMNFSFLSHFYAYVMEGLLDMGEKGMVEEAMQKVAKLQKESGAVPAYQDVDWVCSTGLFQFALVWFRLGDVERGNKAFTYACKLQNSSGGWYGSYLSEENPKEDNTYFPSSEISWAIKYFLDALYYKNIAEFQQCSDSFLSDIDKKDGRYKVVREVISKKYLCEKNPLNILDVGCGKGRYLKNLLEDEPENIYYAVDLSDKVMDYITMEQILKKQGSLTNIDYPDDFFDIVYTCEALEHAIDIQSAIRELARVTKPGGKILIIDKNKAELGRMEIREWETWFDAEELKFMMSAYCSDVHVVDQINYEGERESSLFLAWIGTIAGNKKHEEK